VLLKLLLELVMLGLLELLDLLLEVEVEQEEQEVLLL
jgi:hypothetical protein